jgi:hypothetical protein
VVHVDVLVPLAFFGRPCGLRARVPLLAELYEIGRHVVAARRVAQLIRAAESEVDDDGAAVLDLNKYDQLLKMQEREGRALSSLATRLRITQQATMSEKARKPSQAKRPWE